MLAYRKKLEVKLGSISLSFEVTLKTSPIRTWPSLEIITPFTKVYNLLIITVNNAQQTWPLFATYRSLTSRPPLARSSLQLGSPAVCSRSGSEVADSPVEPAAPSRIVPATSSGPISVENVGITAVVWLVRFGCCSSFAWFSPSEDQECYTITRTYKYAGMHCGHF